MNKHEEKQNVTVLPVKNYVTDVHQLKESWIINHPIELRCPRTLLEIARTAKHSHIGWMDRKINQRCCQKLMFVPRLRKKIAILQVVSFVSSKKWSSRLTLSVNKLKKLSDRRQVSAQLFVCFPRNGVKICVRLGYWLEAVLTQGHFYRTKSRSWMDIFSLICDMEYIVKQYKYLKTTWDEILYTWDAFTRSI